MKKRQLLVSAMGPDRVGFVDQVTEALVRHGANIEESRMARLAGEFAALLLITVEESLVEDLSEDLGGLGSRNMEVMIRPVAERSVLFEDYRLYILAVTGADHEGIIRSIAHVLTEMGINIAELESDVTNAPTTGTPLFNMSATLQLPPQLPLERVRESLKKAAEQTSVTVQLDPA